VLVYGDTNSTLAATLAAAKIHRRVAHLESGLRSGNRRMPEEHNRVVTDHVADLLLAPTGTAMAHLADEGLALRSVNVGDVMVDVCLAVHELTDAVPPAMPDAWNPDEPPVLATIHRADNTDDPGRLELILERLAAVPYEVMLVAHPRLVAKAAEAGLDLDRPGITPIPSLTYSQMVYATAHARGVITDSGGLQKEAFILGTPAITARTETEWPETLVDDWNVIDPELLVDPVAHFARIRPASTSFPFGRGDAAQRAVEALAAALS
ncbi:MAG: UDP-N-acetylglucosamine 2-epimerase, partial [Pseudolysinimonas sp.]